MPDRDALATAFLETTAWAGGRRAPLAGDASNRRYERVFQRETGKAAVLMDAPPDRGEDVRPFVRIAKDLRGIGLSAPDIIAENPKAGFLLLEDLGDGLFSRILNADPSQEMRLYTGATDVLIHLHQHEFPLLEPFSGTLIAEHADLVFDTYVAPVSGEVDPALRSRVRAQLEEALHQVAHPAPVMVLRDFHADNLLWLPERDGLARIGLLDFQDAMAGHPAFDVMSLLQDVRRDVSAATEAAMIRHYVEQTSWNDHDFRSAYAVFGALRSIRILAVFGRLSLSYSKPHYLDYMPRTWRNLTINLEHPILAPVADTLLGILPSPTPENLNRLKPS